MPNPVVLAIDGNSLVHRSFHAQTNSEQPAWAVRGLLSQLVAAVDRVRPTSVVIGFDDPCASLRRTRWSQYKANRPPKLTTLVDQLASAVEVMRELGAAVVVPTGLEADDVLASASRFARERGARTVIVTSDRDSFALIDEHTDVLRIINGGVDASPLMTAERLVMLLGVRPDQYRDYAALRGDPSDNLPGVQGIGPKSAARLLAEFGTAAAAFEDLDKVRDTLGTGIASRLAHADAQPAWALNCQVMALHDEIALELDLADGPGLLPFGAGVVEAVFHAHNLTWSAAQAVRVLADAEPEQPRPPRAEPPPWDGSDLWAARPRPRPETRPARPTPPVTAQLSLFD